MSHSITRPCWDDEPISSELFGDALRLSARRSRSAIETKDNYVERSFFSWPKLRAERSVTPEFTNGDAREAITGVTLHNRLEVVVRGLKDERHRRAWTTELPRFLIAVELHGLSSYAGPALVI